MMQRDPDSLLCDARWNAVMAEAERCAAFGDLAEFGVYRGGTSVGLAEIAKRHGRKLHLFDSFAGLKEATLPGETEDLKGALVWFSSKVHEKMEAARFYSVDDYWLHICDLEHPFRMPNSISFALIDLDRGKATAAALTRCNAEIHPGGAIIVDDYLNERCNGVKLVVDLLLAPGHPIEVIAGVPHSMALIRRKV